MSSDSASVSGDRSFATAVVTAFGDLAVRYRLQEVFSSPNRPVLASEVAELTVQLERGQVFVDIGPRGGAENFDLGEILRLRSPEAEFRYADSSMTTLADELHRLEKLVALNGGSLLGGDFSEAPALLELRAQRFRDLTIGDR